MIQKAFKLMLGLIECLRHIFLHKLGYCCCHALSVYFEMFLSFHAYKLHVVSAYIRMCTHNIFTAIFQVNVH